MLLFQILAHTIQGKIYKSHSKTIDLKFLPTWNDKFELPDVSYSISDIQDYFNYVIKKHETFTDNPLIKIYVNKTENWITFIIKTDIINYF